ncbi:putative GTP-binding protein 6 isoform X2 [Hydra vulgaris]|uniref:GTP-binding protein 6 isoform X2 n=1 Tax=Hydra vulgaris TaxID=6087 RepID=A0ABM4BXP0_HYDVU
MYKKWNQIVRTVNFKKSISVFHPNLKKSNKDILNASKNDFKLKKESPFIYNAFETSTDEKSLNVKLAYQHANNLSEVDEKERVHIIQPNFKWGKHRHLTKLCESRLEEAEALINSIEHWKVNSTCIESIHEDNPKMFFGSGKLNEISDHVKKLVESEEITAVFINTGKLTSQQIKELQSALGCKIFDRYRVVLDLFKKRAGTKEAQLQVKLAEIQYLRSHLTSDEANYDQQRGGGMMMSGAGETIIDIKRRTLNLEESKIKKMLLHIREHHSQIKADRLEKRFPHVALVGYTNAGKTTLAKCLSHDISLTPEDKLFATLDSTAHKGKLPCGLSIIYMDTVGFISDLPHELVESFSTTLDDLKTADLLLHVCDCSHPEFELQIETVSNVLMKLNLPKNLLSNMVNVFNKVDVSNALQLQDSKDAYFVSAKYGDGIDNLRLAIEKKILSLTKRRVVNICIDQTGNELSWLYHNATVVKTVSNQDGTLDVVTILDSATQNKFEKHFKKCLQ